MNDQMLIQILRWLMKPKVWRFVGFGSAVVGLLCYALSSSFNHLFGKWTFLKIILYSLFSLIISLMILYAKIWRHSRSLRLKVHMGFLVLTITSIYSTFSDRVMNGKPDAYSLISSAAFAIMSLSLSRQTQCGFEVDLLYYFLGDSDALAIGRHHSMTERVMTDLYNTCSSLRLKAEPLKRYTDVANGERVCSSLIPINRIIELLEKKLVEKSKIYRDPALRYVFMMNNRRHMQSGSFFGDIGVVLGNDWFQKNREKVQQYLELYRRSSWNKVLELLKLDDNEPMASDFAADLIKEKLDSFNMRFEEMSRVQSTWCVYDKKLREEIITSLENILLPLPAHGMFIGKFLSVLGEHAHEYI